LRAFRVTTGPESLFRNPKGADEGGLPGNRKKKRPMGRAETNLFEKKKDACEGSQPYWGREAHRGNSY